MSFFSILAFSWVCYIYYRPLDGAFREQHEYPTDVNNEID